MSILENSEGIVSQKFNFHFGLEHCASCFHMNTKKIDLTTLNSTELQFLLLQKKHTLDYN